jgi:DNA end-binding protein Ku
LSPLASTAAPLSSRATEVFAQTRKVAIGQLIRQGHEHLVAIKALKGGLVLCILRYPYELREPKPYFEDINSKPESEAVGLAKELIESESGPFEPQKLPDKYAETLRELLRAKVEQADIPSMVQYAR